MAHVSSILTQDSLNLNFKASFNQDVEKFTVDVNDAFLLNTKLKASLTRFVEESNQSDGAGGPSRGFVEKVAHHWATSYDWRKIEAEINENFQQFTTTVEISNPNFPDPIPLHFVHHRSSRPDAIPLLFIHGWPGSFLEVEYLLEPLTKPANDSLPAFHVVAPSIPGYGFSPSPRRPGMGYRAAAACFHALMQKLGYSQYVFQGGDAGSLIGHFAALDFPDAVVSGHSNFWVSWPSCEDIERKAAGQASSDETYVIEKLEEFAKDHWAYGVIQQTRPLRLAIAMTDSPVGLAMWIYDVAVGGFQDPQVLSLDRLLTWTMMHWINGPYGAFSLYKNGHEDGVITVDRINAITYISQPIGISQFPWDIWYRTPLEWARRNGNVVFLKRHERGGHFASTDAPDLLIEDIRMFFSDKKLSGTNVFQDDRGRND